MSAKRGFGAVDPVKRLEICKKGGKNVPSEMRSFSQDRELAKRAGRKGGANVAPENRSFSRDRSLAIEAGRKGGRRSQAKARDIKEGQSAES